MSGHKLPPTPGGKVLCEVCQITDLDVVGHRWSQRHRGADVPTCEPARSAAARLTRQRRGRPLDGPIMREGWRTCERPSCPRPATRCSTLCARCVSNRPKHGHDLWQINANVLGSAPLGEREPLGFDCITREALLAARA